MQQEPIGILSMLSETISLPVSTQELALSYSTAKPFPHLVIDNMFPDELLERVLGEIPEMDDRKWVRESHDRSIKSNLRSAVYLGPAGYELASFLHFAKFLYLLSELTGIWGLLPDPYMSGAGYHVLPSGGHFDVHADRNVDQELGLQRRLAMLIYLNKDWRREYGGQLELWDQAGTRCEKVIEPEYNRTVIMEVGDRNFHGVRPVLSQTRMRKSFAEYYHTSGKGDLVPHSSIYAPIFYVKSPLYKRIIVGITPPILLGSMKRLLKRYY
jgi:2OG-Fe(II) oxygenase superfamily